MISFYTPYQLIKEWRDNNIAALQFSTDELQHFHDTIIRNTFEITLNEMIKNFQQPPCDFSWFVMGSAGRCEQAVMSDQDHGLIYEDTSKKTSDYFLEFGKRLCSALDYIGYPYCEGNVMSSNPLWCQSKSNWEDLIYNWIDENSWASLRNLLIFFDARVVIGKEQPIQQLKNIIYKSIEKHPYLIRRLFENTMYIEKAVGIFNQFLTEAYGPYPGCINLKRTAFFPYVNAIRLLAIIENIDETSTLSRLKKLSEQGEHNRNLDPYYENFKKLLQYRLHEEKTSNYEDVHYLQVKNLKKAEKHEIKQLLKDGRKLQRYTESVVNRKMKNED
ncbi:DUF294 nucleotidyltransferase-like domain-containing protein [Calidifontibacillus oryziterrae]|uniref:DUF294 nucleotidyltransferase-like domain-containing protein n=1 Tax=Calidifontibacillus oryziterrae TaxID=1191699 RepID=UPI00030DA212|nr:DUF294 nucleotidyltransferase-like domain-containing protein [Calidifontibacillus oryziterrae]